MKQFSLRNWFSKLSAGKVQEFSKITLRFCEFDKIKI